MFLFSRMAATLKSVEPNGRGKTNAFILRVLTDAAPLKCWYIPRHLEVNLQNPKGCGYALAAMATRLDAADMPSGRRTVQRSSIPSTLKKTSAVPGGRLMGASTSRKPGPIGATGRDLPLTTSRIFTWAEWPP